MTRPIAAPVEIPMAFVDRLTHRLSRFSHYFFWACVLLALAFCAYIGVSAFRH